MECLPYADIIRRYDGPETFFYIDPPYWDCETYYGKGIFNREDFTLLAEQLKNIKGTFLLSLNDTPNVREVFEDFAIEGVQTKYTCCNGKNMPAGEVFITK